MFSRLKLGQKLLIAFLCVGVIPFAVVGLSSLIKASNALEYAAFNQLNAVQGIKKKQIENFFNERKGDMTVLLDTIETFVDENADKMLAIQKNKKEAIEEIGEQWILDVEGMSDDDLLSEGIDHCKQFIKTGKKTAAYREFSLEVDTFTKRSGYYDFFVIDTTGLCVYSTAKEADYKSNLLTGPYKNSGLGHATRNAMQGKTYIDDFSPYAPSNGEQSAFIAAPIKDGDKIVGVVALQIPTDEIQAITADRTGLGHSGEAYLIGTLDGQIAMRSNRTVKSDKIGDAKKGQDIDKAMAGETGWMFKKGSSGAMEMSTYTPLEIPGLKWAMVTSMSLEEAIAKKEEGASEDYFSRYIQQYGYYDLFLIEPGGQAYYTVSKEADYKTNMVNGKYADSNLGELVRQVLQTRQYGVADFAPYAPSNNEPCAFIAAPIIHQGKVEQVIAMQLSLEAINSIMQQRDGMGETGETYLVGPDKLMRSDSFLDPTNHSVKASFANPATGSVDTEAAREALAGRNDAKIIIDYNGQPVLSDYAPLKIGDKTWAVIAEIDEAEAFAAVNSLKWVIGIVFVIGLGAIISVALMITRSITQPVTKTVHMLEEMAKGHLNIRLNMDRADEIGQMAKTMDAFADSLQNEMVAALNKLAAGDLTFDATPHDEADAIRNSLKKTGDDLNTLISDILTATEQVASGSGQVSDSSQSLSQGATEQAASLEEITSSMTEMGSQTKLNAENATQANQLAGQTKTAAEGGNAKMQEMVTAMGEINEAGQNISKIIKVIDEIAFQTNLLALNAAVEAARAGRHGKGFAVVAEEVRNLAARSAKAAKETAELIEGSVEKTKNGTKIAEATSDALAEIVTSVTKVTDLVGEIAAASNEQAQGINQTNQALGQIDQVTQQNTASAEESAAASEELSGQAMNMKEMMSRFTVRDMGSGSGRQQASLPSPTQSTPQNGSWGGGQQTAARKSAPAPSDLIALDDKEFGKY